MRHPFQLIPLGIGSVLLAIFVVITLSIWWLLNNIGQPLTIPGVAPLGIVSLEFAFTPETAKKIVKAWVEGKVIDRAIKLQWVDFLFMVAYSTTLSLACIWSNQLLSGFDSRWLGAGIFLAWGQWVAAVFDAIENLSLFPFLYNSPAGDKFQLALVAGVSAGLKFGLILLGLLYFLISVGLKIFG